MTSSSPDIALVSTERNWGGGEEQARLLACGLRRRGLSCTLLARDGGLFAERMTELGFEVVRFRGNGRHPASLWQIRRALQRVRPDVLHCNDSHALTAAGIASMGLKIPVRVASRRVVFPLRSPRPYRWWADRVLCVSQAVAEVCVAGGLARDRLRVVYDGVDPARATGGDRVRGRRALGSTDEEFLLLVVAKLTDCKGHAYLLEALPEVLSHCPRVRLAVAGDGELADELKAMSRRLGVESQVRFVGYRSDVPDLIQAADLFVLPSHTEGLCSTLIDAMFAGKPIVTTTAGGIPEVVGFNTAQVAGEPTAVSTSAAASASTAALTSTAASAAWCVPPRDSVALARAVVEAVRSPEECRCRSEAGQCRARALFTADRMVESTLAVYAER